MNDSEEELIIKIIKEKEYCKVIYCFFPIWLELKESETNGIEGVWSNIACKIDSWTSLGQLSGGFLFLPYFKKEHYFIKVYQYAVILLKEKLNS